MKPGQHTIAFQNNKKVHNTEKVIFFVTGTLLIFIPLPALCLNTQQPVPNNTVQVSEMSSESSAAQYFGKASGYIHPFLSLDGRYSDNIYNTEKNEINDFLTTISPGIWIATPRSRERVLNLDPSNTAPGGLANELRRGELPNKFQAYALYEADILNYSSESQNDVTDHTAEGMLSYMFSGGLTLELIDKYIRSHDDFNSDGSSNGILQKYDSNILNFSVNYRLSPKFRIEGEYTNFYLDYDRDERAYRDRTDNGGALYLYYTYSPKTSFFLNGEYVQSSFDTATENDADQYNLYAGMQWRPTGKTSVRTRLGYVNRSLDEGDLEDASEFAGDLRIGYDITEKTNISLLGASNIAIPDNSDYTFMRRNLLRLGYRQNITPKIMATLYAQLENNDYQGGIQSDREDDYFRVSPSLQYTFKDWVRTTISYIYQNRDSNLDENDYSSNVFFVNLTLSF